MWNVWSTSGNGSRALSIPVAEASGNRVLAMDTTLAQCTGLLRRVCIADHAQRRAGEAEVRA